MTRPISGPQGRFKENRFLAANIMPPMVATYSGEFTINSTGGVLGAAPRSGVVRDVWLSVSASGKDDTNSLYVEADVFINGTTCLTTKPKIAHVSGEASQQKTTKVTGDTGVTQRVLASTNTFNPGDIFTYNFELTRTATPTSEIDDVALVVEFEPDK